MLFLMNTNFWMMLMQIMSEIIMKFYTLLIIFSEFSFFKLFLTYFTDFELQFILIKFIIFINKSDESSKKSDHKKFSWLKILSLFFLFKYLIISEYEDILILKNFQFISLFKNVDSDSVSELQTIIEESEYLTNFLKNYFIMIFSCKRIYFIWNMYFTLNFSLFLAF